MRGKSIKAQHSSIPRVRKEYSYKRKGLGTFRRDNVYNTDGFCSMSQIDTSDYPFVKSANSIEHTLREYTGKILDFMICDGIIYAAVFREGAIYLYEYDTIKNTFTQTYLYDTEDNNPEHYMLVRYNEFSSDVSPITGAYARRVLLLPLYCSFDIDVKMFEFPEEYTTPSCNIGVVFMSRLFSAYAGKLFASEFNRFNSYNFDTADSSLSSNAWMSNTQSNTKAGGEITALAVYDGHVVVFKRDYMMQVYNKENPFRLVDIGSWGCISKRAVCEFDGKLAFISPEGPMLYSGGYPYFIGKELNIKDWEGSMLCASGKYLYVYVASEECIYVYDAEHNSWGHRETKPINNLCGDHTGVYYVRNGNIIRLGTSAPKEFSLKTDKNSLGHNGKKRISEIGAVAILGEGAKLNIDLLDEQDAVYATVSVEGAGEHIISEKIKGVSLDFAQLSFSGSGAVKIGEYWINYRKEDE